MDFTITTSPSLLKELNFLNSALEKKSTIPALQNIAIEPLAENKLKLLATDLDTSIVTTIAVDSNNSLKPGLINCKKLNELLSNLPNNTFCKIKQLDNGFVELKTDRSKYKIVGMNRDQYPEVEKHQLSDSMQFNAKTFNQLLRYALIGVSTEENQRFALQGALLLIEENQYSLIATDGHRLALPVAQQDFSAKKESFTFPIKCLIPRKTLVNLLKLTEGSTDEQTIDFSFAPAQVCFRLGEKTIYSRTLSGQFPNHELVLPKEVNLVAKVNKDELKQAIKRVTLMADAKGHGIKFSMSDSLLTLSTKNTEIGEGNEIIGIDYNNKLLEVGFNAIYLQQFLDVIDSEQLSISFKDINTQGLLQPITENKSVSYKYVVMPLRI